MVISAHSGGLGPALKTLARRSAVPVALHLGTDKRLPESAEVAAYYVVAEALTNAAKYAQASGVRVSVDADCAHLRLSISDDGVGGADSHKGSGLIGLVDRVQALGDSCGSPASLGAERHYWRRSHSKSPDLRRGRRFRVAGRHRWVQAVTTRPCSSATLEVQETDPPVYR